MSRLRRLPLLSQRQQTSKKPMRISQILTIILSLLSLSLPACHKTHAEQAEAEHHRIVVTAPYARDVVVTQQYVCLIQSQRHIEVCALANGYLEEIALKEGQAVKEGAVMFKIVPIL